MANGFGSLQVGASGIRSSQNALNVIANNLANVDTKGYVRQQVIFEDQNYQDFNTAAVGKQQSGLGVGIADIVHSRDVFLDRQFRTANGKNAFYDTNYEATIQVETLLREGSGEAFSNTIDDLYEAMSEFSKDPSDAANQSVLSQTVNLFLKQAGAIYDDLKDYQSNINARVEDTVAQINKLAKNIYELNIRIMGVEAGNVETAMEMRDARDYALDKLSELANIDYSETPEGVVRVRLEGVDLVTEARAYTIDTLEDKTTGFLTPYWPYLSEPKNDKFYKVLNTEDIDPANDHDVGKLKALVLSRGTEYSNYTSITGLTPEDYTKKIGNSVLMNTEAELDLLVHNIMTAINDLFSPTVEYGQTGNLVDADGNPLLDKDGNPRSIGTDTLVLDEENCYVGAAGKIPPEEIFSRNVRSRYEEAYVEQPDGSRKKVYIFNKEDPRDYSSLYTLGNVSVNQAIIQDQSEIAHKQQNGNIAYDLGKKMMDIWDEKIYTLNPADNTPCGFSDFYTKMIGELSNQGSVFRTKSETLTASVNTIESSRQGIIGVAADEELTNMIRFQNAYNASSRYMNVVSQMIEHLLTSLGR